jgi:hypothetical protein
MDRISQVEVLDHRGRVGGVVIHIVTVAYLRRAAVAAPVMGDDPVALAEKIEQLRIPIVSAQRPSVVEDDRLGALRSPVLKVDISAVFGGDHSHGIGSSFLLDFGRHHRFAQIDTRLRFFFAFRGTGFGRGAVPSSIALISDPAIDRLV